MIVNSLVARTNDDRDKQEYSSETNFRVQLIFANRKGNTCAMGVVS
jgi:hypothetical protein